MSSRKKGKDAVVLPEKIPFLETIQDFDVTIEIIECKFYDTRLTEFLKLDCFSSISWIGRKPHSNKGPLSWEAYALHRYWGA